MTVRNISQISNSVNKLAGDKVKHTTVKNITENGKDLLVTAEHDEIVQVADQLRKIASKLLADEREYAEQAVVEIMMKDKASLIEYVKEMRGEKPRHESVQSSENFNF